MNFNIIFNLLFTHNFNVNNFYHSFIYIFQLKTYELNPNSSSDLMIEQLNIISLLFLSSHTTYNSPQYLTN